MFLVHSEPALDGETNMARDRELYAQAEAQGRPGCRVYSWDGPWISLGFQQRAERDLLDADLAPWVKRPTGGYAVLHGHDVTVGMALPLTLCDASARSVKAVYRRLTIPLIHALNRSGLKVALADDTPHVQGVPSADCFAQVSSFDIVDISTGLKACGCAMKVGRKAALLQASIPAGAPLLDPALLFELPHRAFGKDWDTGRFAAELDCALKESLLAPI